LAFQAADLGYLAVMDEPVANPPPRRYRWPWIVAVALIVWVLLAVVWMVFAVRQVEERRDGGAPPTSGR
jgi:hypothetical protein